MIYSSLSSVCLILCFNVLDRSATSPGREVVASCRRRSVVPCTVLLPLTRSSCSRGIPIVGSVCPPVEAEAWLPSFQIAAVIHSVGTLGRFCSPCCCEVCLWCLWAVWWAWMVVSLAVCNQPLCHSFRHTEGQCLIPVSWRGLVQELSARCHVPWSSFLPKAGVTWNGTSLSQRSLPAVVGQVLLLGDTCQGG